MTYLSAKNSKTMVIAQKYSNSSPFSSNPQINLGKKFLGIPYSSLIMQIYFILNGRRRSLIFFFLFFFFLPSAVTVDIKLNLSNIVRAKALKMLSRRRQKADDCMRPSSVLMHSFCRCTLVNNNFLWLC